MARHRFGIADRETVEDAVSRGIFAAPRDAEDVSEGDRVVYHALRDEADDSKVRSFLALGGAEIDGDGTLKRFPCDWNGDAQNVASCEVMRDLDAVVDEGNWRGETGARLPEIGGSDFRILAGAMTGG